MTEEFTVTGSDEDCNCGIKGDPDGNGLANPVDVVCLVKYIHQGEDALVDPPDCSFPTGDLNNDYLAHPKEMLPVGLISNSAGFAFGVFVRW